MDLPTEMQHQAMGYDRAATMFSPDWHLLQVEYAEKVVRFGSTSMGFVCKDGVVIIADKRIRDKLIAPESSHKIFEIDEHIIATAAGILSDARVLVDSAQILAQQNRVTYNSPIEPIEVIRMIADRKQMSTQYGGVRPYGISVMLAGVNKDQGHLYVTDVTGNFTGYKASAIGENDEKIKEILRRDFKESISVEDAIKFGMKIFKEVLEKNFDLSRFEIAFVKKDDGKLERHQGDALKKYVK